MKTNVSVYFLLFFLCFSVTYAQHSREKPKDTLQTLLEKVNEDILKYQYQQAVDKAYDLVTLAKEKENNLYVSRAYHSLGHIYSDTKDLARARQNYTFGLEYAEKTGNDSIILTSYNNLGNALSENPAFRDEGISYYNKAIKLAKELNMKEELIAPTTNIGWTYLDANQYDKAFPYLDRALELMLDEVQENDSRYNSWLSQMYMLHGRYYAHKKAFDSAHVYYDKSLQLAEKDSLYITAAEAYKYYAGFLEKEGDYQGAFNAQRKFTEFNDLIFENEKVREMEIADAKFKLSEYEKDLEIAQREQSLKDELIDRSKEKVIIMVISSVVLVFILVFLFKINRDRRNLISELQKKNKQYKSARDQAENLSRMKTRFFSTVSHEIRTPLYGVIGLTSLLLEDKRLKKHKTDLKSLKFSADYLLALINDVLQMNKMESNEVKLESVSFNIRELLSSIVNSFEFTRVQNKNEINLDIDDQIPSYLIGDSVRLSQVLMNLVGNAMKFTERGLIKISINHLEENTDSAKIHFVIEDNGPGIPESKKKMIFEEFSQLENSNYNYQGTGLGLPIVKKLLKLFGSKIKLDTKEGEGSSFSFTIDFGIDHTKTEVPVIEDDLDQLALHGKKRILIVDDNRINQVVTKRILEKKDFECEVAGDGTTAIEMVRESNYDLVLMDVNMPGISGLEATSEIRTFNKYLPIVALTAVEVEEIREEIQSAGMSDIIIKPYDVQQFYQIIYKNLSMSAIPEKV
ncbi:response regulator [uncultured Christiangramia sp.]|uniref:response regulator n=1 Tax=uncultured Christiangramia sp. TaxID=503836 RepID=UPI0025FCB8E7|nr:response regulator [uncultured Christiangramia sp.]